MKDLMTLTKYEFINVIRSRWLIFYALFFAVFTQVILQFGGDTNKITLSLMNLVLFIIPVVSILFSTIFWYSAENFTQMILTLPIQRRSLYLARVIAISVTLSLCFWIGTILPLLGYRMLSPSTLLLLGLGAILTTIFSTIGLAFGAIIPDRLRGTGFVFLVWLFFAIIHDSLMFFAMMVFRAYPLEYPTIAMLMLNPIALTRMILLMYFDVSALLGYTGLVLQRWFASSEGIVIITVGLIAWIAIPLVLGLHFFKKNDL